MPRHKRIAINQIASFVAKALLLVMKISPAG
jgi:hypothetical protein